MNNIKKLNYVIAFIFLFIGNVFSLFSQSGLQMSVFGFVRDINSNMPIPKVKVILFKIEQNNISAIYRGVSNIEGFYAIDYLDQGEYEFVLDIPTEGLIFLFRLYSKNQNINILSLKEGKNLNLDIFIGQGDKDLESRNDTADGSSVCYNFIYKKYDDTAIINDKYSTLKYEISQTIEYKGLRIRLNEPRVILDTEQLPDSNNPWAAGYCYPGRISFANPPMLYCDRRTVPERKKCDFDRQPTANISFNILLFSKERFKLQMAAKNSAKCSIDDFNDAYIQCEYNCLIQHELKHQELGCDLMKKYWDELWENYKNTSCSCFDECQDVFLRLFDEFLKKFQEDFNDTEDDAKKAQCDCIKSGGCTDLECHKDGITYKMESDCKKNQ